MESFFLVAPANPAESRISKVFGEVDARMKVTRSAWVTEKLAAERSLLKQVPAENGAVYFCCVTDWCKGIGSRWSTLQKASRYKTDVRAAAAIRTDMSFWAALCPIS